MNLPLLTRAPIRVRLTAWYVLLLALVLAAFGTGVYLLMRHNLYQSLEESIEARAETLAGSAVYEDGPPNLNIQPGASTPEEAEQFVRVFDGSGVVTTDTTMAIGPIPVNHQAVVAGLAGGTTSYRLQAGPEGETFRVGSFPIVREGRTVGVLEVGQSEDDTSETLATLLLIIGLAYPVTLAVASLGGLFLAGRALAPVSKITGMASRISEENLSQRLDLNLPDDELGRLAHTFDQMIARLDDAFRRQRQFTADASHELRTPLTIIKGRIDVSLQRDRDPDAYREVLLEVNEEVDHLIRLAGSLLTLTRADAGQIPLALDTIEIGEIVTGVFEQVQPAATAKGVGLQVEHGPPLTINADEDLILQLMLNLVDNAIKYTPSGGQVRANWALEEDKLLVSVKDNGVGIAPEHTANIFDRFYRVDSARSRTDGGVGLGLAISRWIAEAHGGEVLVESRPGAGSAFTIVLPMHH